MAAVFFEFGTYIPVRANENFYVYRKNVTQVRICLQKKADAGRLHIIIWYVIRNTKGTSSTSVIQRGVSHFGGLLTELVSSSKSPLNTKVCRTSLTAAQTIIILIDD